MSNNKKRKSFNHIVSEPMAGHRMRLFFRLQAAQLPQNPQPFTHDDLKQVLNNVAGKDAALKQEAENALEAVKTGNLARTPDITSPEKQFIWGASLAYLEANPQASEDWDQPFQKETLKQSPFWQGLTSKNKYTLGELIRHATHIRETLRSSDTKHSWSMPGEGTKFEAAKKHIKIDLMQSLLVGMEHARAEVQREIGYGLLSKTYPKRMQEIAKEMRPLVQKSQKAAAKKGPQLTQEEYKQMLMLDAEMQLRKMMFDAAEENTIGRYVSNLSNLQDYGVSLNNTSVTSRSLGMKKLPKGDQVSEDLKRYMNLVNAVQMSFYQNNDLFANDDKAWKKAGIETDWIRQTSTFKKRKNFDEDGKGINHDDFKLLRDLCAGRKGLENLQPTKMDRLYGQDSYNRSIMRNDAYRNEVIERIWELFGEDLLQKILDQTNDQIDEKLEQAEENQQNQDDPQNGDPQDGDPQQGDPQQGDPQQGDPQQGDPQQGDPQQGDPQQGDPQQGDPQQGDPQQGDPQQGDPQQGDPQQGDPQQGDPQQGDPQQGDPQQGDPQQGDPQQGDPQQGDPQQGDPQQGDSSQDSKPQDSQDQSGDPQNGDPSQDSASQDNQDQSGDPQDAQPQDGQQQDGQQQGDQQDVPDFAKDDQGDPDSTVPVEDAGDMPAVDMPADNPEDARNDNDGQDGQENDGNDQDGNSQDGNDQDGNSQDGNDQDGNSQDGNDQDGNSQDANDQDGNSQDGNDGQNGDEGQTLEEMQQQADQMAQQEAEGQDGQDGQDQDGQDGQDGQDQGSDADQAGNAQDQQSNEAGKNQGESLENLSQKDWSQYADRIRELQPHIQRARKLFKQVQERQVMHAKRRSRDLEILPENGEVMDRFNLEAHKNLTIKKKMGDVEEQDLKRFHVDEHFDVPTELDIVIMVDGSGSMGGTPLNSALQSAAILREAAASKDMKMNVYVGLWGDDNAPMIVTPDMKPKQIGEIMERARSGLHSGTSMAPSVKRVAETIADKRSKGSVFQGFTHVLYISDGDIQDPEPTKKNIETMFQFCDKVTVDVAVLKGRAGSQMENAAKKVSGRSKAQEVGVTLETDPNKIPMSIIGLLVDKTRKCGSFTPITNDEKRRQMKKAANKMGRGR